MSAPLFGPEPRPTHQEMRRREAWRRRIHLIADRLAILGITVGTILVIVTVARFTLAWARTL